MWGRAQREATRRCASDWGGAGRGGRTQVAGVNQSSGNDEATDAARSL